MNNELKELGLYFNNEKPLSRTQGLKIITAIHDYISMLEDRIDNLETSYLRNRKALEIIKKYLSMNRAFKNLANKESCNLTLVEIKALIPDEEYEQIKEVFYEKED